MRMRHSRRSESQPSPRRSMKPSATTRTTRATMTTGSKTPRPTRPSRRFASHTASAPPRTRPRQVAVTNRRMRESRPALSAPGPAGSCRRMRRQSTPESRGAGDGARARSRGSSPRELAARSRCPDPSARPRSFGRALTAPRGDASVRPWSSSCSPPSPPSRSRWLWPRLPRPARRRRPTRAPGPRRPRRLPSRLRSTPSASCDRRRPAGRSRSCRAAARRASSRSARRRSARGSSRSVPTRSRSTSTASASRRG